MPVCADQPLPVIPAKAGTHLPMVAAGYNGPKWIPAFAGMTVFVFLALFLFAVPAFAQAAPAAPPVDNGGALTRALGQVSGDGRSLSLSLQILILMSLLTVLPSLVLMMTSFTRIIIVLSLLRQALGLQQTPPNQRKK